MKVLSGSSRKRFWKGVSALTTTEYALMAGFVTVAAGAFAPRIATEISIIFSKVVAASKVIGG